jgi:hypothetical protein
MSGLRWSVLAAVLPALVSGCATSVPSSAAPTREHVLHEIFRASVQVVVERGGAPERWGSGVVIGAHPGRAGTECLIVTAGHTLSHGSGDEEVSVLLDRHEAAPVKIPAEVAAVRDTDTLDLALLKIHSDRCAPVATAGAPSLGDPIWIVGFPRGGNMTLATGIVSQVDPTAAAAADRFIVDASSAHGSSGGGVFEASTGRLLGIVEAFGTARVSMGAQSSGAYIDVPMPGMTYVTPVGRITEFVRTAGLSGVLPRTQASR